MRRTYQYRLYPNRTQTPALDLLLWQGRTLYNAALEQRITTYRATGKGITYPAQWAHFRDLRHASPATLGQLNATSVQQMLRRLDKSFRAFFRRLGQSDKPGFPRFKGRHRFHSLEYRHGDGCKLREQAGRPRFYVQNVGEIKIKMHRPLPEGAKLGHKNTRELVDTFGWIAVEDLSLAFMTRNRHLALSAHDASLGMLRPLLDYKAESAGSLVVAVDPRNTSQACSQCGEIVPKSLGVRTHRCPHCGLVEDRDINAARNILQLSLSSLGRSDQASTWPEVRACVA